MGKTGKKSVRRKRKKIKAIKNSIAYRLFLVYKQLTEVVKKSQQFLIKLKKQDENKQFFFWYGYKLLRPLRIMFELLRSG